MAIALRMATRLFSLVRFFMVLGESNAKPGWLQVVVPYLIGAIARTTSPEAAETFGKYGWCDMVQKSAKDNFGADYGKPLVSG